MCYAHVGGHFALLGPHNMPYFTLENLQRLYITPATIPDYSGYNIIFSYQGNIIICNENVQPCSKWNYQKGTSKTWSTLETNMLREEYIPGMTVVDVMDQIWVLGGFKDGVNSE